MPLAILNVAYPLARVAPDVAGGAEQVLLTLDRALVDRGHTSIVIARDDSEIAGTLVGTPGQRPPYDSHAIEDAHRAHCFAVEDAVARYRPDVVHLHGCDFFAYLPKPGAPVLVTLHLPLAWYPPWALMPARLNTWLHCVSKAQHATRPPGTRFLAPIENGVALEPLCDSRDRAYALFLGRICPEKGVHLAIEAAHIARIPLVIAGEVHPYESHLRYFEEQIRPALGPRIRYVGPVAPFRRNILLAGARCLLVTSLAQETSVLVAREALAAGTPVIGFRLSALLDLIEDGRTGFLVESAEAMAKAIHRTAEIDNETCRSSAARFALAPMLDAYLGLYETLAAGGLAERAGAA